MFHLLIVLVRRNESDNKNVLFLLPISKQVESRFTTSRIEGAYSAVRLWLFNTIDDDGRSISCFLLHYPPLETTAR